jgi:uncharacterized membrane protein
MARRSSRKTDFFRRVGDAVLKVDRLPGEFRRRIKVRKKKAPPKMEIPRILRGFFERRHTGWPEYVMLKAQLGIIALFVATVLYVVLLREEVLVFIPVLLAVSSYLVHLTATQLKRAFGPDYPAYRSFMAMCLAIAWVFVVALRHSPFKPSVEVVHLTIIPPLVAILFVVGAFAAFRFKYGRNFTFGRVERVHGRRAVVHVGYDIRSNVKAGLYPVDCFVRVKEGDLVKLSVERSFLGLRGSKVGAVLGKVAPGRGAGRK